MYPILELKSGRERSVLHQHPWIFSGAVKTLPKAENGEIIAVRDNKNNILGYGFFAPKSQIVCRLFEFGKIEKVIDENYWIAKIQRAYELRKKYLINSKTNAYRLLHAEGDFFPGVIVDVYDSVAVLQLLIKGTEKIYTYIVKALQKQGIRHIFLKTKENSKLLEDMQIPAGWLTEEPETDLIICENDFRFLIDVQKGQKTGFFLDQRENRLLLKYYAQNQKILNAFSYTGAFSVYALAGGAKEVHSVDISKDAIAVCEKTIRLNFGESATHQVFSADCFEYLRKTEEKYDLIILDPPAFAKNAKSVPNAARGYKDLNLLGFKNVNSGGLVFTFSCSGNIDRDLFRKIVFGAAADAGKNIRIIHQLTQPLDHPINIYHPEGEYLKGLVLYVE